MTLFGKSVPKFFNESDGSATVEFVVLFPAVMTLFLAGFEAGYYMVRDVSLDRAVDVAIRDVRLGNGNQAGSVPSYDALKSRICNETGIIPDCMNSLKVEIMPVAKQPGGIATALGGQIRCIDKSAPPGTDQTGTYNVGAENQLMLIHVCAIAEPLFPTSMLGVGMLADAQGNTSIVTTTAFVNEPGQRTINLPNPGGGGSDGGINSGTQG